MDGNNLLIPSDDNSPPAEPADGDQSYPGRDHNEPPELLDQDVDEHLVALPVIGNFDYTVLDEAVAGAIHAEAKIIRDNLQRERTSRWDTGARLLRVKEMLIHGEFGEWLRLEFGMSSATASRYMNLARRLTDTDFCTVQNLHSSIQYKLTRKDVSQEFIQQIIDEIRRGELKLGDPNLDGEILARLEGMKPGAPQTVSKSQRKAFTDEIHAKEAVKYLRRQLHPDRYRELQLMLRGIGGSTLLQVLLAEKPAYTLGIVTGTPVTSNGLPLDAGKFVAYRRDRDTTPLPIFATLKDDDDWKRLFPHF